jgi:hypothetical protein
MYKKTASAKGNILKGPTTGYPALLHGTEAVVPLPDGRAIPVEMKQQPTSSMESTNASAVALLSASVDAQTAKMTELVSLMQRNNTLTSGILQASM